jgi:hypothetical protein
LKLRRCGISTGRDVLASMPSLLYGLNVSEYAEASPL